MTDHAFRPDLVPVLMYHSIAATSSAAFAPFVVPEELFAEHVGFLAAEGYVGLTAAELASRRRTGQRLPDRCVVLTFDDGFRDFVTNAVPVLQASRMRSTLFVPTGFVGSTSRWLVAEGETRRALLSWDELSALEDVGVEVGAHSHSHPQLDLLGRDAVAREIALSTMLLEDHLQRPVRSFAYPFGYADRTARELVAQLGLESAYAVGDLTSTSADDPYAVPRLTVTPETSVADLAELLTAPRIRRDELRARGRGLASRALRTTRLKKRANSPGRAPLVPTRPAR